MNKRITFFLGLVLWSATVSGQMFKMEGGIFLGGANIQGDLVEPDVFQVEHTTFAYGLHFRYHLSPIFALRANYLHSDLQGNDSNFGGRKTRGFNFTTPLNEFSAQLEWDILGKQRYEGEVFRPVFSPYLFVGAGISMFKPKTDFGKLESDPVNLEKIKQDQNADYSKILPAIPVGLGVKVDLSERWVIGLELGMRAAFTDYLDGVSQAGNPNRDDWYAFYGATVSRRFGLKDADNDKIADRYDACPTEFGSASLQGCPDQDGDLVTDAEDACPTVFGLPQLQGCPDRDGDHIADYLDKCPDVAGINTLEGCPDQDKDGVADHIDLCPTIAGMTDRGGCPFADEDKDGIEDALDKCPQQAGLAANNGCPLDSDMDGINDVVDECPTEAGSLASRGCPDMDSDGIADRQDKCPEEFGLEKYQGCPTAFGKEEEVMDLNVRAIWFATAETDIKQPAIPTLDEAAIIMLSNPGLKLRINGYTDNMGNQLINQQLSEMRAKRCFDYLISLGVDPMRMIYQGYGETTPLGNNDTPEGRRLNRRVEIKLIDSQ